MLYKIKNREGKYFQKVVGNVYELRDGNHFKMSEWDNKGRVLDEKELQSAIKRLTQMAKPTCVRPYPLYPTYSVGDLEIVTFSEGN